MSGPFTAYCYRLVLDGIEHIAMVKVDVLLCLDCFHDGRFVIGHSSIDFLRVDATKEFDDLDGESWTNQETLLLLEAMEIYNENWNEIAEHVGTKSKAQCILHFICLPMEDGPLENIAVPSVSLSSNLSNRDDFERPHSSSNGDSAGSCLEDPDSEHRLPFAYFANPVMALVFRRKMCSRELEEIGKKIAKECLGLPLSIVVVAGMLADEEKRQDRWKQVEESINSPMVADPQLWMKT